MSLVLVTLASAAAGFGVLALMFGPLERSWQAREQAVLRPELGLDLKYFAGQYLVWNVGTLALLSALRPVLRVTADDSVFARPSVLGAAAVVLAGDLCVYWFHRACHQVPWLWRIHAVHHSVEHLDWVAGHREHPLDGLLTMLVVNLPALLVGFPLEWLSPFIIFRGLWAVFIHANVQVPLGPLKWLCGAPEWHRWHHAKLEKTVHNFGNLAPWTDLLFGTHHRTGGDETYALGLEPRLPGGYLAQLASPFSASSGSASRELSDLPAPPAAP